MSGFDAALVSRSPGETRVALTVGGRLAEFHIFRDCRPQVRDIVLGRVLGRVRGVDAAFIDIGATEDAFLGAEDCPDRRLPDDGAAVVVEVLQAPRAGKGAKVTAKPSLAGTVLALTPRHPGASLSSKITNKAERSRLTGWATTALTNGEGLIVRTGAFEASEAALNAELARLRAQWTEIMARVATVQPPARLWGTEPLAAALAGRSARTVVCEGPDVFLAARASRPDLAPVMERWEGGSLFAAEGIDDELDDALTRTLMLPAGGRLSIEETAAVVAIDVDTAGASTDAVNAAAVAEIARQIRLRNLGGLIVIDFAAPGKAARRARDACAVTLAAALAGDSVPVSVLGQTAGGLVEVRRDRHGAPLSVLSKGAEATALEALRQVLAVMRDRPGSRPTLHVALGVGQLLAGRLSAARLEAERVLGHPLTVSARPDAPLTLIDVTA